MRGTRRCIRDDKLTPIGMNRTDNYENLLTKVFPYTPREGHTPLENFCTEVFAILRAAPERVSASKPVESPPKSNTARGQNDGIELSVATWGSGASPNWHEPVPRTAPPPTNVVVPRNGTATNFLSGTNVVPRPDTALFQQRLAAFRTNGTIFHAIGTNSNAKSTP